MVAGCGFRTDAFLFIFLFFFLFCPVLLAVCTVLQMYVTGCLEKVTMVQLQGQQDVPLTQSVEWTDSCSI